MRPDIVIRNGTVVDGTGSPGRVADVAISGDVIVAVVDADDGGVDATGRREIDAEGRLVTPGFVDIHTHLDAQIAWDPIGSSSCWHGVTSVVMGNCGVTFAPCKPEDRRLPRRDDGERRGHPAPTPSSTGLPWDWETYGEYLATRSIACRRASNVGGMVGHCALRPYAMGERGLDEAPATGDDIAAMSRPGRRGDGRRRARRLDQPHVPAPGARRPARAGHVRHGRRAARLRRGAGPPSAPASSRVRCRSVRASATTTASTTPAPKWRWMGEISRRSGRPVSFGLTQYDSRPDLYRARSSTSPRTRTRWRRGASADHGARRRRAVRPGHRTPFDGAPSWKELRATRQRPQAGRLIRDAAFRPTLIERGRRARPEHRPRAAVHRQPPGGDARYDLRPGRHRWRPMPDRRGVSPAAAYIELLLETDGARGRAAARS